MAMACALRAPSDFSLYLADGLPANNMDIQREAMALCAHAEVESCIEWMYTKQGTHCITDRC
jgi:hypothetical protein